LAHLLSGVEDSSRWRLVAEFLEEYRWEPPETRVELLVDEPAGTGDQRWDVFLAALAEYVSARDDRAAPPWTESRTLRQFWFGAGRVPSTRRVRRGAGTGGCVSLDDPGAAGTICGK
jgi:hypothetical protein